MVARVYLINRVPETEGLSLQQIPAPAHLMTAMLGLPEPVAACLCDLDGVLTQTANVHAAAWKQALDGYLHERAHAEMRSLSRLTRSVLLRVCRW